MQRWIWLPVLLALALAQTSPPVAGGLPSWLRTGQVYLYDLTTTVQGTTQTATVAYLVEAVGRQWAAVKMITLGKNPPQLATAMLAVNANQSPFFVSPTLRDQVAAGRLPGAHLEGNTLILRQPMAEVRTTFDPTTGLVKRSETQTQAMGQAATTVLSYRGTASVPLPHLALPSIAKSPPRYRFQQSTPMGRVSGETRYRLLTVDGPVVVYQVFTKSPLTQGAEVPSGTMAGSPIEGPFYLNPAILAGKPPGSVIQEIPAIGYRLVLAEQAGSEARLALAQGAVSIELRVDTESGLIRSTTTTMPGGSARIELLGAPPAPPAGGKPGPAGVGTPAPLPPTAAPLPPAPPASAAGAPGSGGGAAQPPMNAGNVPPSPTGGAGTTGTPPLPPTGTETPPSAGPEPSQDPLDAFLALKAPAPSTLTPGTYFQKRIVYRFPTEEAPGRPAEGIQTVAYALVLVTGNAGGRAAGLTLLADLENRSFLFLPSELRFHVVGPELLARARKAGFRVEPNRIHGENDSAVLDVTFDPATGVVQQLRYAEKEAGGQEGETMEIVTVGKGRIELPACGLRLPATLHFTERTGNETLPGSLTLAPIAKSIYRAQGDWELWGMHGGGEAFYLAANLSPFSACPELKGRDTLLALPDIGLALLAKPTPEGFALVLRYQGEERARLVFDANGQLLRYQGQSFDEPYQMEVTR